MTDKQVLDKGHSFSEPENNLGCKLTVFLKALMIGITVENFDELVEHNYSVPQDKYVDFWQNDIHIKNYTPYFYDNKLAYLQINFGDDGEWCVYVKDYGKTWWLRGEK